MRSRAEAAPEGVPALGYHPELDGLRAIAIGGVLAYHASAEVFPGGYLGVDLFFVLSGFLITTLLMRERQATGRIDLRNFYIRRVLRIMPPLIVGLTFAAALSLTGMLEPWPPGNLLKVVAPVLLFFANWVHFESLGVMHHMWSLAVEEQFYLIWPLVLVALRGSPLPFLFGLAALGPIARTVMLAEGVDLETAVEPVYRIVRPDGLAIGCIAALVSWRPPAWLTTAALVAISVALLVCPREPMIGVGLTLFAIPAAILIKGATVLPDEHPLRWVLAHPAMVWAGRRSYGAYVYHFPIVALLLAYREENGLPLVVLGPLLAVLTFAVAEVSYRFVEQPILQLKRRFQPAAA